MALPNGVEELVGTQVVCEVTMMHAKHLPASPCI